MAAAADVVKQNKEMDLNPVGYESVLTGFFLIFKVHKRIWNSQTGYGKIKMFKTHGHKGKET